MLSITEEFPKYSSSYNLHCIMESNTLPWSGTGLNYVTKLWILTQPGIFNWATHTSNLVTYVKAQQSKCHSWLCTTVMTIINMINIYIKLYISHLILMHLIAYLFIFPKGLAWIRAYLRSGVPNSKKKKKNSKRQTKLTFQKVFPGRISFFQASESSEMTAQGSYHVNYCNWWLHNIYWGKNLFFSSQTVAIPSPKTSAVLGSVGYNME